jgi:4,5-epoxidase
MAPVVIAGAGPTGLALGCGLLSMGVEVRIVDGARGPATTSRALGLQPRGVEVLDRLGALGDLPQRSVRMNGTVIRVGDRERLRLVVPPAGAIDGPGALVISQAEIEAQLRERIGRLGGHIEWGRELTGIEQDGQGIRIAFADQDGARAQWLVGCDGAGSTVRKSSGIHLVGETTPERFLLADVQLTLPVERGFAAMWVGEDGALAVVPLPGDDRWRLMAPNPPGQPDDLSGDHVIELLTRSVREHLGIAASAIRDVSWTSTFRIHRRLASSYRRGRVLLAGDAAHINSPAGGQGLNTGIGDAENLAWKLGLVVQGRAGPALLDSYQAERRPIAKTVVRSVGGIDTLLTSRNPLVALLRDHVVLRAVNAPAVQLRVWRKASQLGISYRKGPLAQRPTRRIDGRRPGDRIADLPCRHLDGHQTRLHAELGRNWAVLAGTDALSTEAAHVARARLGDRITPLVLADRPADRVQLVRPDAHIAWQGRFRHDDELDRWLTAKLHCRTSTG